MKIIQEMAAGKRNIADQAIRLRQSGKRQAVISVFRFHYYVIRTDNNKDTTASAKQIP
jgi:hypothetical protein